MVRVEGSNEIARLLKMKGKTRLQVDNRVTHRILLHDSFLTPGVALRFLESRIHEGWVEYYALYEIQKYKDIPEYLAFAFKGLSEVLAELEGLGIENCGIQEVETALPEFYYVLIYILEEENSNGRETTNSECMGLG